MGFNSVFKGLNMFPWSTDWINDVHSITKYSTDYGGSLDLPDEVAPSLDT